MCFTSRTSSVNGGSKKESQLAEGSLSSVNCQPEYDDEEANEEEGEEEEEEEEGNEDEGNKEEDTVLVWSFNMMGCTTSIWDNGLVA
jgi:hypothetical protein